MYTNYYLYLNSTLPSELQLQTKRIQISPAWQGFPLEYLHISSIREKKFRAVLCWCYFIYLYIYVSAFIWLMQKWTICCHWILVCIKFCCYSYHFLFHAFTVLFCSQWLFPSVVLFVSFALNRSSLLSVVLFSPFALSRTSYSCFKFVRFCLRSFFGLTRTFALCRTYFLSVVLFSFSFKQISAFRALFPFFLPGDEI